MLIFDTRRIGDRLLAQRKRAGLTQVELAERAGLADRTYADIERGGVNMRVDTLLHICEALGVTPDALLTEPGPVSPRPEELFARLERCSDRERDTALSLLDTYLRSL